MKLTNEFKVGIMAVLAIVIFILGFSFLKGNNVFSVDTTLYAKYPKVNGLSKSAPILVHGFQVGAIDDIRMINEAENKIEVKFHVRPDLVIPNTSTAKIYQKDLLGAMAIELMPVGNGVDIKKGDYLKGLVEASLADQVTQAIGPLQSKVEHIVVSLDTTLGAINGIFNEGTRKNLRKSFTSINEALDHINNATLTIDNLTTKQSNVLAKIMANVESISTNLKNNNKPLSEAINNFSAISDSLKASNLKSTLLAANKAVSDISGIISKIEKGEGTIGQLVKNKSVYTNLESATKNLDVLMADIKSRPFRYVHFSVFGRKQKADKIKDTSKTK